MTSASFNCRACGGNTFDLILDMGALPLANAFVAQPSDTDDHFRASLALVMCAGCRLLQLKEPVPRELLFVNYLWVTGTSDAAARHARWLSARLAARFGGADNAFLVEIASNDGFFLRHYREAGFRVLGVDPSDIGAGANAAGLPTLRNFFGIAVATQIRQEHGTAKVVVARNVLGHSSELRDLMAGVEHVLDADGRFVIEHPYAYLLRDESQYDTVFHEHVSYPTIKAVANLAAQFDMTIVDVEFVDMNGGSMLLELARTAGAAPPAAKGNIAFEDFIKLNEPAGWAGFRDAVLAQRSSLRSLLTQLNEDGHCVVGYGAAAKCMTMLNYCAIDTKLVRAFGDANPRKQGLLCPGVRIPVVSPSELLAMQPDYILVGAWNLKTEIVRSFRDMGYTGRFIVPLPMPVVIE